MSVSDPLADMLTKLRNASNVGHEKVEITLSRLKLEVIKILESEGYISGFKKINKDNIEYIHVFLKYDAKQKAVIHGIESVSTPGRRVYSGYKTMPRVYNGFGSLIVSTSRGVTTGKNAVENKLGGELLCRVW
ncbi:MAG: 30S ribosomal protein S8 [Spirochaetaceae bacterium]|nr:30S ribosomal protein S8 [Spirochaetaceae bacterium]